MLKFGKHLSKVLILVLASSFTFPSVFAQHHDDSKSQEITAWSRTYNYGHPYSVQQTSDDGYVAAGAGGVAIIGGQVFGGVLVTKTDDAGIPEWSNSYATTKYRDANAYSVQLTRDKGYIVAGTAVSAEPFGSPDNTHYDAWLLKLDSKGQVEWNRMFVGPQDEVFFSVEQTTDRGYIVVGSTASFGYGADNTFLVKIGSRGDVVWQRIYTAGIQGWDLAMREIHQTPDGGFVLIGSRPMDNNEVVWVLRLDPSGDIVWQKGYANGRNSHGHSIQITPDDGFIVLADTDPEGIHRFNAWLLKLDSAGHIVWQKSYGGPNTFEKPSSVKETTDGGFVVAGFTISFGVVTDGGWLFKVNSEGDLAWQKVFEPIFFNRYSPSFFESVQPTHDEGFIVAGQTATLTWLVKVDDHGTIPGCEFGRSSNATVTDTHTIPATPTQITPLDVTFPTLKTLKVYSADNSNYPYDPLNVTTQCMSNEGSDESAKEVVVDERHSGLARINDS